MTCDFSCSWWFLESRTSITEVMYFLLLHRVTGPDGAVAMSSTNELVGTGVASPYRLQPRAGF